MTEIGAEKEHDVTYSHIILTSGYKMDWKGQEQKQNARISFCELGERGANGTQLTALTMEVEMKID